MGTPGTHKNQESRILNLLQSRGRAWTPAPELSRISLQYLSIAGLRRLGIVIENRVEIQGGTKHPLHGLSATGSFLSTVHGPVRHSTAREVFSEPRDDSELLFQDSLERHRDNG